MGFIHKLCHNIDRIFLSLERENINSILKMQFAYMPPQVKYATSIAQKLDSPYAECVIKFYYSTIPISAVCT